MAQTAPIPPLLPKSCCTSAPQQHTNDRFLSLPLLRKGSLLRKNGNDLDDCSWPPVGDLRCTPRRTMPNSAPFRRAWTTIIPTPDGPIRMIGYDTGLRDCWHLAFVRLGSEYEYEAHSLWVIPARSCRCLSSGCVPENMSALTREFRRFAKSRRGLAISLFQHPRNFGPLMLGEEGNAPAFLESARCKSPAAETKQTRGLDDRCSIRKILREIGVHDVSLEYPRAPECNTRFIFSSR